MKAFVTLASLFIAAVILSCQDSKEIAPDANQNIGFYKNIGAQISVETANRWIDAYQKLNNDGRIDLFPYTISKDLIESALESVTDPVGVAFHHGIDDEGEHHFIAIPVDGALSVWSDTPGKIYVDANNDEVISWEVARSWASAYEEQNPNQVWFHFFGVNIFNEMSTLSYFRKVDVVPALNDLDLTPQVLLIVRNINSLSNGRGLDGGSTVYDMSSPCPPCPYK
jgi:hypothetical protein